MMNSLGEGRFGPGEARAAAGGNGVVGGRPQLLRAMNEESVLYALRRSGPLVRADLTRWCGLSKPTVGLTLANLERAGLVRAAGHHRGDRGPSATLYEANPGAGCVLALDVGREYLRGALCDLGGGVLARGDRRAHSAGGHARTAQAIDLASAMAGAAGVPLAAVTQAVVGSPGIYDPGKDAVILARGLPGWGYAGVGAQLRAALGARTVLENDINLAALAERDIGHGRVVATFAFVSVGTGIGMGLVVGGRLHKGAHGAAGEIAFLPLSTDVPVDVSDARRRGPLEAAASAAGVVRAARQAGLTGRLSARSVFEAAVSGDAGAAGAVNRAATLVAQAIAAVVLVADPGLVVLGGGIGSAPGFADRVAERLRTLVPVAPEVRVSAMGAEATVTGGLRLGIDLAWKALLDRS
jgi:predicted NBD/HSP70 family sugar kinase